MATRPFSPTLRARPRRSAALGAWHVKVDELKRSPGIDSLESGSGRTIVSGRSAGIEEALGPSSGEAGEPKRRDDARQT